MDTSMMAEIFMLRLEAAARAAKEAAGTSARFVPITLPAAEGVLTAHQLNQHPWVSRQPAARPRCFHLLSAGRTFGSV
jgi:hypothetical protein